MQHLWWRPVRDFARDALITLAIFTSFAIEAADAAAIVDWMRASQESLFVVYVLKVMEYAIIVCEALAIVLGVLVNTWARIKRSFKNG